MNTGLNGSIWQITLKRISPKCIQSTYHLTHDTHTIIIAHFFIILIIWTNQYNPIIDINWKLFCLSWSNVKKLETIIKLFTFFLSFPYLLIHVVLFFDSIFVFYTSYRGTILNNNMYFLFSNFIFSLSPYHHQQQTRVSKYSYLIFVLSWVSIFISSVVLWDKIKYNSNNKVSFCMFAEF